MKMANAQLLELWLISHSVCFCSSFWVFGPHVKYWLVPPTREFTVNGWSMLSCLQNDGVYCFFSITSSVSKTKSRAKVISWELKSQIPNARLISASEKIWTNWNNLYYLRLLEISSWKYKTAGGYKVSWSRLLKQEVWRECYCLVPSMNLLGVILLRILCKVIKWIYLLRKEKEGHCDWEHGLRSGAHLSLN